MPGWRAPASHGRVICHRMSVCGMSVICFTSAVLHSDGSIPRRSLNRSSAQWTGRACFLVSSIDLLDSLKPLIDSQYLPFGSGPNWNQPFASDVVVAAVTWGCPSATSSISVSAHRPSEYLPQNCPHSAPEGRIGLSAGSMHAFRCRAQWKAADTSANAPAGLDDFCTPVMRTGRPRSHFCQTTLNRGL
jgi:hypothetical protein